MKKIIDWLTHWPKDKVLHFTLCLVVAIIAGVVAKLCGGGKYEVMAAGWFVGFFAGFGKELYDEAKYGGADEKDWAADLLGTTLGCIILLILVW